MAWRGWRAHLRIFLCLYWEFGVICGGTFEDSPLVCANTRLMYSTVLRVLPLLCDLLYASDAVYIAHLPIVAPLSPCSRHKCDLYQHLVLPVHASPCSPTPRCDQPIRGCNDQCFHMHAFSHHQNGESVLSYTAVPLHFLCRSACALSYAATNSFLLDH